MRVTVVEATDSNLVAAPHDPPGSAWVDLPLTDDHHGDLPQVGEVIDVEFDDDFWIFERVAAVRAVLSALHPCGSADAMTFKLGKGVVVDLSGLGVPVRFKGQAARLKFWHLVPDGGKVVGHFAHRDVGAWVAELESTRAARQEADRRGSQLRRRRSARDRSQDVFVNPYTFVPFPESGPRRETPAGHHTLAAGVNGELRFQGTITARLTARSPLLVRAIGADVGAVGVSAAARTPQGRLFIPGSSLHGAVRSLHEALTGSCLRVFDPDVVPVYRDVASGGLRSGWDLGVVEETDANGRPTALRRCSETKWVRLQTVNRAIGAVVSGQRLALDPARFAADNGRDVYADDGDIEADPAGGWVVLVTDSAARDPRRRYYCAVGRIAPSSPTVQLTDRAWAAFQRAAEGAKQHFAGRGQVRPDLREEQRRLAAPGATLADVLGSPVDGRYGEATWLRPRAWLHPGQVVWLSPAEGRYVGGMALSYLWRTAGQGAAGIRLPVDEDGGLGFEPCHDPDDLCPSCAVFGSADTRAASSAGVDRRVAEQRSYRGHVRVLDAVLESGGVLDEPVPLPALGAPRPGSGQFYLDDSDAGKRVTLEYQRPRNRWGVPDATSPRRLRGRKFYWQTDLVVDERRGRWRRHEHAPEGISAELVATGSVYRLRLTFDGLTRAQLGGLVAALQPGRLFATQPDPLPYPTDSPPEFAIHVGGGKPLGLGSCKVDDLVVDGDDAASRYLRTRPRPGLDPDELVGAFVAAHADRMAASWHAVAAALHTDHVDSRVVSYPTATAWADPAGRCSGKKQHEAFRWFQQTTGEDLRNGREKPYVALPAVSDIAPSLPIDVLEGR